MPDSKVTIAVPGEIDGEPAEVEAQVLADLEVLLDAVAAFVDAAARQLANAERSRIIDEEPSIGAAQLTQMYDESERAGSLTRLVGATKAMCSAAAEVG